MSSALISADALYKLLPTTGIKVLDGTYPAHMAEPVRIPNAVTFDIDDVADPEHPLPHTAPDALTFQKKVRELGINRDDHIVVYDQHGGYMAAARVWWLFRLFGHENIQVLDGGLKAWMDSGYEVGHMQTALPPEGDFEAELNKDLIKTHADIVENLVNPQFAVLDARAPERFENEGHIPDSQNMFFGKFIDPKTGKFNNKAIPQTSKGQPLVASCNSGVTACYTALALYENGFRNVAVYDGSWQDWQRHED
tara:strand:+ start:444 stop:1199 length:756 start_codon:yes stop_codon:yes gene_type:complete